MSSSTSCFDIKWSFPALAVLAIALLSGCNEAGLTAQEKATVQSLSLAELGPLPTIHSNRFADDPAAASLGSKLFFDTRLSRDGNVSCATCHLPAQQLQDGLPLGRGAGTTNRRTMPLAGAAWSPWLFWDGRKDSLWSQALGPMESQVEHAATRTFLAHKIAAHHKAEYEAVFGPIPGLSAFAPSAGPFGNSEEQAAWDAMPQAGRNAIDKVFSNIGKALEAHQRTLSIGQTRFDRYAASLLNNSWFAGAKDQLSPQEIAGLKLFVGRGSCINCHNGPRFTDDHFHNTGVPQAEGLPVDPGRAAAIALVEADPFNCLGAYSDATPDQCGELKFMSRNSHEFERAFKPPTLRGVASRPPYMHSGQIGSIEAVIEHYSKAPAAPQGHSELVPLNLSADEKAALIAFLQTLDPL